MDTLKANYRDEEEDNSSSQTEPTTTTETTTTTTTIVIEATITTETTIPPTITENQIPPIKVKEEPEEIISEVEISEGEISDDENEEEEEDEDEDLQQTQKRKPTQVSEEDDDYEEEEEEENTPRAKKRKSLSQISPVTVKSESPKVPETPETPATDTPTPTPEAEAEAEAAVGGAAVVEGSAVFRRPKKKANNVWTKSTSRKGKKKTKPNGNSNNIVVAEDTVLITPFPKFTDKGDDSPDLNICLSKVYKAEQIELSDDRLSAGSSKGYRMVRATRGVMEGAWYFEIKVSNLGETGHTRLGWSTEKGDLQAPVGYFGNGFAYRDVDGSKVYKAVREKYGEEGYSEGDVIGFYINLPEGSSYAPKPPHLVMYKGQRYAYVPDGKEESPKVVPGSEISFYKNGVCQGVAFKDLCGGRYFPAASMYTLPHQPNCVVKFNFGPDFEFFPQDFEGRPIPTPMIEVPYHEFDGRVENDESAEKKH